jgi:haloacetate dehalogenase
VHAICEEYRAAATIDHASDEEDRRAGRKIFCPVLVLWSAGSGLDTWYSDAGGPLGIWRDWANDVSGYAIPGGHLSAAELRRDDRRVARVLRQVVARRLNR